jgi:hypothetical protein
VSTAQYDHMGIALTLITGLQDKKVGWCMLCAIRALAEKHWLKNIQNGCYDPREVHKNLLREYTCIWV